MARTSARFVLPVLCVLMSSRGASAQDAAMVIAEASRMIGATELNSVTYSGNAAQGNFGQSRTITFGIASTSIRNYTRTIDFTTSTALITGDTMPPAVRGGPPPQPGQLRQLITADAPWAQQLQIWVTPWGFLRGAAANHATVRSQKIDGEPYRVVTWMTPQKAPSGVQYKLVGYIDASNLIERVETWVEHPVLGDERLEFFYSDYRDLGGVRAPLRMTQKQVGMETFVATTATARGNPRDLAALMTSPSAGSPPPVAPLPPAASEKLADGVYRITGGYVSMAVEFRDFVVVLEGGQSDARGQAILAETKRLFPNKRIRYVVNTHPHFDHAGGLGPFIADGITVLADDNAKYFLEQAFGTPRTLVGDTLAKSKKKPRVEGVVEKQLLTDGARNLELHHVAGLEHSDSMLIAYLPKEKILFCADFRLPSDQPEPSLVTLRENIERLQLDVDRVGDGSRAESRPTDHEGRPDRPRQGDELMRGYVIAGCCSALLLATFAANAGAHHSFGQYYLESDTLEIEGQVVEFQYKNPHTWIHVDAQDPFGRRVVYAAEWGSVSGLERQGVLKNTVKIGDRVRLWISPNRNPNDNRVRLKRIQLPDGRTLGGQNRQQDR